MGSEKEGKARDGRESELKVPRAPCAACADGSGTLSALGLLARTGEGHFQLKARSGGNGQEVLERVAIVQAVASRVDINEPTDVKDSKVYNERRMDYRPVGQ